MKLILSEESVYWLSGPRNRGLPAVTGTYTRA